MEQRLLLDSGGLIGDPPGGMFAPPQAMVFLTTTIDEPVNLPPDAANTPRPLLPEVLAGDTFRLEVRVEDLRPDDDHDPTNGPGDQFGVYSAYLDLRYNPDHLSIPPGQSDAGPGRPQIPVPLSFRNGDYGLLPESSPYTEYVYRNGVQGDAATPGLVDNVGAFTDSHVPLGHGRTFLFDLVFRAEAIRARSDFVTAASGVPLQIPVLVNDELIQGPTDILASGPSLHGSHPFGSEFLLFGDTGMGGGVMGIGAIVPEPEILFVPASIQISNPGTLQVVAHTAPSKGTVDLLPNGIFQYTANVPGPDTDSFTYTLSDGRGNTQQATVTVEILGGPTPGDPLEPNDSLAEATPLGMLTGSHLIPALSIHLDPTGIGNDDYYRFELASVGQADNRVEIHFAHAQADLDLKLFDGSGNFLRISDSETDDELISLDGLPAGEYILWVYSFDGEPHPQYDLLIDAPNGPAGGDAQEPNDTPAAAVDLGMVNGLVELDSLSILPAGDEDWFRFELPVPPGLGDGVSIFFSDADGDLDLSLFRLTGDPAAGGGLEPIAESAGVGNIEQISMTGLPPGVYFAQVIGYDGDTNPSYILLIDGPGAPPDDLEPNDTPIAAADLGVVETELQWEHLNIHQSDNEDWYRFQTTGTAQIGDAVSIAFENDLGDLDLAVFREDVTGGLLPVGFSEGVDDVERVVLDGQPAGDFLIQVIGFDGETNPDYTLTIEKQAAAIPADVAEPNESLLAAHDLGTLQGHSQQVGLTIHEPGDADWFRFETLAAGAGSDSVSIRFDHDAGDLDLEVYRFEPLVLQVPEGGAAAISDGESFILDTADSWLIFEFDFDGQVFPEAVPVPLSAGQTADQVAATIAGLFSEAVNHGAGAVEIAGTFTGQRPSLDPPLIAEDVHVSLSVVELDQTPGIQPGEAFDVEVHFTEVASGMSVFAGFADVLIDPMLMRLDDITPGSSFPNGTSGGFPIGAPFPPFGMGTPLPPPGTTGPFPGVMAASDVNGDGLLSAFDVLVINQHLLEYGGGLPAGANGPPFLDVNGDGFVTPLDMLQVINELNSLPPDWMFPSPLFASVGGFTSSTSGPTAETLVATLHLTALESGLVPLFAVPRPQPGCDVLSWSAQSPVPSSAFYGGLELNIGEPVDFRFAMADTSMTSLTHVGGFEVVGTASGVRDEERVSLAGQPAGTYYVHAYGFDGETSPDYQLTIQAPFGGEVAGDRLEPNDDQATAYDFRVIEGTLTESGLNIHEAGNADWYRFQTTAAGTANDAVSLSFDHAQGDLDMLLYREDASGKREPAGHSLSTSSTERVSLNGLPAGVYYIEVVGYDGDLNPDYTLTIRAPRAAGIPADRFEANDTLETAHNFRSVAGPLAVDGLSIHSAGDEDWFRFETAAPSLNGHSVLIDLLGPGDLDLSLYDSAGGLIGTSATVNDRERIRLAGLPPGVYYAQVKGFQDAVNPEYRLELNTPEPALADEAEPNDSREAAYDLREVVGPLLLPPLSIDTSGNEDWFRFETLDEGHSFDFVAIDFIHAQGDLALELYDATGTLLARSRTDLDFEEISLQGRYAGEYFLRVFGESGAINPMYHLFVHGPLPGTPTNPGYPTDAFEPNDGRETANDLRTVESRTELTDLTIHQAGNADWFRFQTVGTGAAGHYVRIDFAHGAGDLDLELHGPDGLIAASESMDDFEQISLAGLSAGVYWVKAFGYAGAVHPEYALVIEPPRSTGQTLAADRFEANDTAATATLLRSDAVSGVLAGPQTVAGLTIHNDADEDYFRFTTAGDGTAAHGITLQYLHANGDLNVELLDSQGQVVRAGNSQTDNEFMSLEGLPAAEYRLRIFGVAGSTNQYSLTIDAPAGAAVKDAWTIMVYMTASDLDVFAMRDVNEIEQAVSRLPGSVNISVLWDQSALESTFPTGGGSQAAWGTVGRAIMTPDDNPYVVATSFEILPEQNTGAPETLSDFIRWSTQAAPAENYGLVLWDHGGGLYGFNFDNADGMPADHLTTAELVAALQAPDVPALSLISFDACLMASVEVGYSLRDLTEVFVASQEVVGGDGHDYTTLFETLETAPQLVSPAELASGFVRSFEDQYGGMPGGLDTYSAIDAGAYDALGAALASFVQVASQAGEADWEILRAARNAAVGYEFPEFRDLGGFLSMIAASTATASVRDAAGAVIDVLQTAVIAQTSDVRDSSGISVYLPAYGGQVGSFFTADHAPFDGATGWSDLLVLLGDMGGDAAGWLDGRSIVAPDWSERNDVASNAFDLHQVVDSGNTFGHLNLHTQDDVDWFRFTVANGAQAGHRAQVIPSTTTDSLKLELYDAAGATLLATASGAGAQSVSLANLPGGAYNVRIQSTDGQSVAGYTLAIDAPGENNGTDWAGDNSTLEKAYNLGLISNQVFVSGLGVRPDTQDFFTFQTPRTTGARAFKARVLVPEGQTLTAELRDAAGTVVSSGSGSGTLLLPYMASGAGESFTLVISGPDAATRNVLGVPFNILFNNINLAPVGLDLSNLAIEENAGGVLIGDLIPEDLDDFQFQFSIGDNPWVEVRDGKLYMKEDVNLDYEALAEKTIEVAVTVTDRGGGSLTQTFSIAVMDRNEAPLLELAETVVRERVAGVPVGLLSVIDPEQDLQNISLSDDRFELVNGMLQLRPGEHLSALAGSEFAIDVTAVDPDDPEVQSTTRFTLTVEANPRPAQNPERPFDVDGDTWVIPMDVLSLINEINLNGTRVLDQSYTQPFGGKYFDVNGDNKIEPLDVLQLINFINLQDAQPAEGEAPPASPIPGAETLTATVNPADRGQTPQLALAQIPAVGAPQSQIRESQTSGDGLADFTSASWLDCGLDEVLAEIAEDVRHEWNLPDAAGLLRRL